MNTTKIEYVEFKIFLATKFMYLCYEPLITITNLPSISSNGLKK